MKHPFLCIIAILLWSTCWAQQENGRENARPTSGCGNSIIPVFIFREPTQQHLCPGQPARLIAHAVNVSSRSWEMSTDSGETWYPSIGQLSTSIDNDTYYDTLTIPIIYAEMIGYRFRAKYYSICGNSTYYSTAVILQLNNDSTSISTQPANSTLCIGNSTSFSIDATGGSLSYQWQQSTSGAGMFMDMPGKDTRLLPLYNITADMNNYRFRCVITSACAATVTSAAALLRVNPDTTNITLQPTYSILCDGATANFTTTATGNNLQYQWQQRVQGSNTYTDITGATNNSLDVSPPADTNFYRCAITSTCNTVYTQEARAYHLEEPVLPPTAIYTKCVGDFTRIWIPDIMNTSRQWMVSTDSGNTYSNMPGETASALTVTSSEANSGYRYKCYFSNACFQGYSNVTTVYTTPAPLTITSQTASQSTCFAVPVNLSVNVAGSVDGYQWQQSFDGGNSFIDIYSGDEWALNFSTLSNTYAAEGIYLLRCKITGRCAPAIYSNPVTLTIFNNPAIKPDTLITVSCDTCKTDLSNILDSTIFNTVSFRAIDLNSNTSIPADPRSAGLGRYQLRIKNANECYASLTIYVAIKRTDTIQLCPFGTTTFIAPVAGSTYQWEINNGRGAGFVPFEDYTPGALSAYNFSSGYFTRTLRVREFKAPCIIRCKVDGAYLANEYMIRFPSFWTGAVSNAWENPLNWTCGMPAPFTEVYISRNAPFQPVISSFGRQCRTLIVEPGANITIKSGMTLSVDDYFR